MDLTKKLVIVFMLAILAVSCNLQGNSGGSGSSGNFSLEGESGGN